MRPLAADLLIFLAALFLGATAHSLLTDDIRADLVRTTAERDTALARLEEAQALSDTLLASCVPRD